MPRYPRFTPGERVILTKRAIAAGLQGRARSPYGVVIAHSRERVDRLSVRIRRDGLRSVDSYYVRFWRHVRRTDA